MVSEMLEPLKSKLNKFDSTKLLYFIMQFLKDSTGNEIAPLPCNSFQFIPISRLSVKDEFFIVENSNLTFLNAQLKNSQSVKLQFLIFTLVNWQL